MLASAIAATLLFANAAPCRADGGYSLLSGVHDYFANWFQRVDEIRSTQPDWITPVATVTPLLEEEMRYDQVWQTAPGGIGINKFAEKGLELIPWYRVELILGHPPYITSTRPGKSGLGDWKALIKYRVLAANRERGNYALSLFMGFSAPTGEASESKGHAIFTPTIAFGKGWGDFDFQSTVGVSFPDGGEDRLGMPLKWNTAFQYRILKKIWPEVEANYTWWPNGERTGENQLFITPGIVFGGFHIWKRLHLTVGAGYQVAVTRNREYNNGVILSVRMPF